ncbi:MAG: cyclic nucleotide-binding domain-containing protein, partial [Prochlorococcaceae cyanobacterium]
MSSNTQTTELLHGFHPFDRLQVAVTAAVEPLLQQRRFRLGQTVLRSDVMPDGVLLLRSGSLRCLATDPTNGEQRTIDRLEIGAIVGWVSILRNEPCEQVRATSDVEILVLPAALFRDLLDQHGALLEWFQNTLPASELYRLLTALSDQDPAWLPALRSWPALLQQAQVRSLPPGPELTLPLASDLRWFFSSGGPLAQPCPSDAALPPPRPGAAWLRLVGLPPPLEVPTTGGLVTPRPAGPPSAPISVSALSIERHVQAPALTAPAAPPADVDAGGAYALSPPPPAGRAEGRGETLRLQRAVGAREAPIAITFALAGYFGLPLNRDSLRDQVDSVLRRQPALNLVNLGQILDSLGLRVVLTKLPADRLHRTTTPAVFFAQGHFAILEGVEPDGRLR